MDKNFNIVISIKIIVTKGEVAEDNIDILITISVKSNYFFLH